MFRVLDFLGGVRINLQAVPGPQEQIQRAAEDEREGDDQPQEL